MLMLNVNVECQYGATNWLHMAAQGVPMAAHGPHMAAQRQLLSALGVAYGCSEAPYGCPWGPYGCSEAVFGCPWGRIWLLPCGRYAENAVYGWAGLGSQDPENMPS